MSKPLSKPRKKRVFAAKEIAGLSEAHYQTLIELLPQIVWMADASGTTTYCNQYWYDYSGLTASETAGSGWTKVLHPDDREQAVREWQNAMSSGSPFASEFRLRRAADGQYRWHMAKGSPFKDTHGKVVKWIGVALDDHDHKLMDAELARKGEQLAVAVDVAGLGIFETEASKEEIAISERLREILGLSPFAVLDRPTLISLIHPEDRPRVREIQQQAFGGRGTADFDHEFRIIRPDGQMRWLTVSGRFRFADLAMKRQFVGSSGAILDITSQKLATDALKNSEAYLRASEARFRALLENSSDAVALFNAEWKVVYASPAVERILGYTLSEFVGMSALSLLHSDDQDGIAPRLQECLDNPGKSVQTVARVRRKDGSYRVMEGVLTNLLDDPNVRGVVNNFRDMTEKFAAENAMRASEEKFKRAFRSSPDAMTISTLRNGLYLDLNDAFLRMTGWKRSEVIGRTSADIAIWIDRNDREKMLRLLQASGTIESLQTRFKTKFGATIFAQLSAEVMPIEGQECVLIITRDVTEKMRADEELRESEERYRSVIENSPYGICQTTREGRFLMVNPSLVRMLGYDSAEEVLALDMRSQVYANGDERDRLWRDSGVDLGRSLAAQVQYFETIWKRKDGEPISVRLAARAIYGDHGDLQKIEVFVENVTRQRALEKQLQIAQKMEAIGQLAGGVSHDFNNLLMIMGSRAELLMDRAHEPERVVAQAEEIVRATRRAATLTRQLLAFSRTQVLQPVVLNLNNLLAELGNMLPRVIGENIETKIITTPNVGRVKVDRGQFEQVAMNLAINARDAMPDGGKLVIETGNVELDTYYCSRHPQVKPGRYVLLSVTDTGIGMDVETQARIFEPFFTTKERGKGTGLGLAMVYGIVEQSGGHISVYSHRGTGSSFKIYLPEVAASSREESTEDLAPVAGGTETILFVEDEEALRQVGCEFLRSKGYDVLVAENGVEALNIFRERHQSIRLLITDVIMPRMGGTELARQAVAVNPKIQTIFVSGYSGHALPAGTLAPSQSFLQKPFSMALLARQVRATLDGASTSEHFVVSPR